MSEQKVTKYKERLNSLKSKSLSELKSILKTQLRIVSTSGYGKDTAISEILENEFGTRFMDEMSSKNKSSDNITARKILDKFDKDKSEMKGDGGFSRHNSLSKLRINKFHDGSDYQDAISILQENGGLKYVVGTLDKKVNSSDLKFINTRGKESLKRFNIKGFESISDKKVQLTLINPLKNKDDIDECIFECMNLFRHYKKDNTTNMSIGMYYNTSDRNYKLTQFLSF